MIRDKRLFIHFRSGSQKQSPTRSHEQDYFQPYDTADQISIELAWWQLSYYLCIIDRHDELRSTRHFP